MTKTKSPGYVDTSVSGVTNINIPAAVLNFGADFAPISVKPEEVILTNLTSPTDRPENIRVARKSVSNIYNTAFGKSISPAARAATSTGIELLVQVTNTIEVTDSEDADFIQQLPMSAHLVVKVPASGVSEADVQTLVGRLLSSLRHQSTDTTIAAGLKAKLRGSLTPKG